MENPVSTHTHASPVFNLMTWLVLLTMGIRLFACDSQQKKRGGPGDFTDSSQIYTDMLGRQVTLKNHIQRVILLRTMDIYLLAAVLGSEMDDKLIATGDPFQISDIDGYRKFSEVFDLSHVQSLGSVYTDDGISVETVMGLEPDIIIVDRQFQERSSVKKMIAVGLPVVFTDLNYDPFYAAQKAIRMLGRMLGTEIKSNQMADYADQKTRETLRRVDSLLASGIHRPVIYFEQGNTIPEEFGTTSGDTSWSWGLFWHRLGADNIGVGSKSQTINQERILTRDPDLIIIGGDNWEPTGNIMRMGFYTTAKKASDHLGLYTERPGWNKLTAIRNRRLYAIYFNYTDRPYNFAGLEAMARMLYPEAFAAVDSEQELSLFFQRFMPFPYSGALYAEWAP